MRALLVVMLCLLPATAHAQDEETRSPPPFPPGEDVITALEANERAPHAGMLLDTNTAIRWTNRLAWFQNELRLVTRSDSDILAAVRRSHQTELDIASSSYTREIDGLRQDLREQAQAFARSQDQPFFDTFTFGLIVGVVVSAVLVGLVAWAISSI